MVKGFTHILIIFFLGIVSCQDKINPQTHLIPCEYTGRVYIFHDIDSGAKGEYVEGRKIFRIPESGVLKTQFKKDYGWIEDNNAVKFVYICNDTFNREIPKYRLINGKVNKSIDSNKVVVLYSGVGIKFSEEEITVVEYYLDTFKNIENNELSNIKIEKYHQLMNQN